MTQYYASRNRSVNHRAAQLAAAAAAAAATAASAFAAAAAAPATAAGPCAGSFMTLASGDTRAPVVQSGEKSRSFQIALRFLLWRGVVRSS